MDVFCTHQSESESDYTKDNDCYSQFSDDSEVGLTHKL